MKDITTDIFHLPAVENKTAPVEQHRSSVNGRIVPDNQVRHPQSHDMFSTTGKLYTYIIDMRQVYMIVIIKAHFNNIDCRRKSN